MKSLNTLIRLHKQKVEELRRRMATLENQRANLQNQAEGLVKELERELALAGKSPEMSGFFGDFADRIRQRREEIAKDIRRVERQMDDLAVKVREAYAEQRKYEIVKERRLEEKRQQEVRRENEQLDEAGQRGFLRRKAESQKTGDTEEA